MQLILSLDGSDSRDKPKLYRLQLSVTEVGTEKLEDSSIQVRPDISTVCTGTTQELLWGVWVLGHFMPEMWTL